MEGDYEQKVQDLSTEKETLRNEKLDKEKENQGLHGEIGQLQEKVYSHIRFAIHVEPYRMNRPLFLARLTVHWTEPHHHQLEHADILSTALF